MTIVNAISTTTIPALQKGETVECIYVVEVILKRPNYDSRNILLLSKLIAGVWASLDDYKIELKGLNLDKIWESLITDIGEIVIEEGNTLDQQMSIDDAKAKHQKMIADIEKKARSEKQPRKRLVYFEQLKQMKMNE